MIVEKFQTFGVIITGKYISEPINESVYFYSCTQAKLPFGFLSSPPGKRKLPISHYPLSIFPQQKGGRITKLKKMTKIELARALVTNFDKFHHLFNLFIFGFCFAVP